MTISMKQILEEQDKIRKQLSEKLAKNPMGLTPLAKLIEISPTTLTLFLTQEKDIKLLPLLKIVKYLEQN